MCAWTLCQSVVEIMCNECGDTSSQQVPKHAFMINWIKIKSAYKTLKNTKTSTRILIKSAYKTLKNTKTSTRILKSLYGEWYVRPITIVNS